MKDLRKIALILVTPLAFGPCPPAAAADPSYPETLTPEERQKMPFLRQILGMPQAAADGRLAAHAETS